MLVFAPDEPVLWTVSAKLPTSSGSETATFSIRYRLMSRKKMDEHHRDVVGSPGNEYQIVSNLLRDHIAGWEDIVDASSNPLPFNTDTLEAVIEYLPLRRTLEVGLIEASLNAPGKLSGVG
jgi:hypothetical protein